MTITVFRSWYWKYNIFITPSLAATGIFLYTSGFNCAGYIAFVMAIIFAVIGVFI